MKILAIDASSMPASAAIVSEEKVIAEITLNFQKTHSQTLMPIIEKLFEYTSIKPNEMDYIACTDGPGSFTGLRIAGATAKGLAHGLGKKIIPVATLDAMAYNIVSGKTAVMLDARRNQVFACMYESDNGAMERLTDYGPYDICDFLDTVSEICDDVVFLGDGALLHKEKILERGFKIAPVSHMEQRAACIGALALQMTDKAVCCESFEINYFRKSQAEREYEEKHK